ncbi:MAG: tol-pal system protein YbgF [Deltaproteobacteria bacterium]|jgi:tol-pal system protein YbgF|nr:tol-pal system protein YbgF [Deltaproteobacteria bacterium]
MLDKIKLMLICGAVFLLSACNGSGINLGGANLEREVNVLRQEVADLRDQLRAGGGGGAATSPQMRLELDSLRTNIQRLNESMETASLGGLTLRQQLEYLSARLDRLEKRANLSPLSLDIVRPTAPIDPSVPVVMPPALPPVPSAASTQGTGGPIDQGPPIVPGPSGTVTLPPPVQPVVNRYEQGKSLYDQKNYTQAIVLFKEYLAVEPKGEQASAAQYYIGESLYFQNQFEDAILEYQVLVSGYPKSTFVSAALLKQGLSFQAIGDTGSAKLLYQKVVRDYPKTYSAGVARERLKTI